VSQGRVVSSLSGDRHPPVDAMS